MEGQKKGKGKNNYASVPLFYAQTDIYVCKQNIINCLGTLNIVIDENDNYLWDVDMAEFYELVAACANLDNIQSLLEENDIDVDPDNHPDYNEYSKEVAEVAANNGACTAQYLELQVIYDCMETNSVPSDPSDLYYTDQYSEGYGTWEDEFLACCTSCGGDMENAPQIELPDLAQRTTIILDVLYELYPDPDPISLIDNTLTWLLTNTAEMDMQEFIYYIAAYQAYKQCMLECNGDFLNAFEIWITEIITHTQNAIIESYINNCYGNLNEEFEIRYYQSFYHYTLYDYDYANNLVRTIPPEGIDYIKIFDTDDPVPPEGNEVYERDPAHRMGSTYKSNSLFTKSYESPDEGKTNYLYDKAGRIRFSQDAQQKIDGYFSYTKYDEESGKVTEVGEYTGSVTFAVAENQNLMEQLEWPANNTEYQTFFEYDDDLLGELSYLEEGYYQKYVNGRLSKMWNENIAVYYGYDAHGRVKYIINNYDIKGMRVRKTVDYEYSVLTSRVEKIIYQKNKAQEKFVHLYEYDDDYRLVNVKVSRDEITWLHAADYEYYKHGPLKTKNLGDHIQKLDYIYNLNGWLKAINNPVETYNEDDGTGLFAIDVFAMALNYYKGDYIRASVGLDEASLTVSQGNTLDLFSGNINNIISNTGFDLTGQSGLRDNMLVQSYQYDYLNRVVDSYTEEYDPGTFTGFTSPSSSGEFTTDGIFSINVNYDANGNITSLKRNAYDGSSPGDNLMDEMTYKYAANNWEEDYNLVLKKLNNRLAHVNDNVLDDIITTDIEDQGMYDENDPNYVYDAKGRLVQDRTNNIALIEWTPYDKIQRIVMVPGTGVQEVTFEYNAMQQRISKFALPEDPDALQEKLIYIYDASGVLMSTYTYIFDPVNVTKDAKLNDFSVYGLSRLGKYRVEEIIGHPAEPVIADNLRFEISDHLGSVRAVVSGEEPEDIAGVKIPHVVNLADYYPFGFDMPGRTYTSESHRYGYQGSERDQEYLQGNAYTTYFRGLDPRLGRWFSPDVVNQPWQSPYCSMDNSPVALIDPLGAQSYKTQGGTGKGGVWQRGKRGGKGGETIQYKTQKGDVINVTGEIVDKFFSSKYSNFDKWYYNNYGDPNFAFNFVNISGASHAADATRVDMPNTESLIFSKQSEEGSKILALLWEMERFLQGTGLKTEQKGGNNWTTTMHIPGGGQETRYTNNPEVLSSNIDLLLTVISTTKSAAGVKLPKSVVEMVKNWLDLYNITNATKEAFVEKRYKPVVKGTTDKSEEENQIKHPIYLLLPEPEIILTESIYENKKGKFYITKDTYNTGNIGYMYWETRYLGETREATRTELIKYGIIKK